ncbi:MAG: undecaprenyldiphospho-muramoylpentapeptide beta-N-acetylglucosaminyltransferase [Oscillospiraceae bacterium]|nr:undecaprenyldiphospho-muramoylpentapeptide beta-N-acetylglucosaminyltransferase [Clostridiaceae bacterium]MDY5949498.1 undecaprenyldiphospho-muramoylpentapeptide beta-N-acetylglucosaminyltransferase [Oscillospiraceae bacterium]
MLDNKRILIAAGGTGGHINPALGTAGYIKEHAENAQIVFVGTADKMEATLVPQAGYELRTIEISGFWRSFSPEAVKHNIGTVVKLVKSSSQVKKIINDFKPDLVVGFGGYVSGPVLRTAAKMRIPTAIHEQNAFPGVTNKALAGSVDRVMLTVPQAEQYMKPKNPCVITGLPIRGDILKADADFARAELSLGGKPLVLSMGGSLGAKPVNDAVLGMILNKYKDKDCVFLHATGKGGDWFTEKLRSSGVDLEANPHIRVVEYIDIPKCLPAADLVICRSGASTLSELQALGKPSILIPSPYVTENHQYHNAMALVNNGAAEILEEKDLTPDSLTARVNALLADKEKLFEIGANAAKMAVLDATKRIYDTLCEITD